MIAVPVVASFATAWTLSSITAVPSTFVGAAARWVLIAVAASIVLVAAERLTRRLAPLATLLALSLTFPDRAPPRLRIALRNGSTRQLRDRIAEAHEGDLGGTPAEAAERVLELVAALSMHDRATRGHSERVRAYSRMLGEELGLGDDERDQLQWAGLLHDVGKLLVSDAILNKPDRLTPAEYAEVCKHPEHGRAMVAPLVSWLGESARAVWEHHERWDGGGYPAGLAGLDIALAARIVNVADTFDVMTSTRSYKEPVSPAESRAELARCSGGQFDPVVVRAFLNISIGRLRLVMGPISLLAQVPLFPTSVLSGAVGGNVATFAATLAVVGVSTLGPLDFVEGAPAQASVVGQVSNNGYVAESPGLSAEVVPPSQAVTTTTEAASGDGQVLEDATQFAESDLSLGVAATTSTSSPRGTPVVLVTPTGVRVTSTLAPSAPDVTPPSPPVLTPPSSPVVTVPSPVVTLPLPVVVQVPSPVVSQPSPTASFVNLGAAESFAVLASAAVTSTGLTSITGNVGTTSAATTGLMPGQVHLGEFFDTSPTTAAAAHAGGSGRSAPRQHSARRLTSSGRFSPTTRSLPPRMSP